MSDLYIFSKTERFNFLLKKRAQDFQNLVSSVKTFNQLSTKEFTIIHENPDAILIVDGIIINNGIEIENILQLALNNSVVIVKNLYKNEEVYHYLKAGVKGLTSLDNFYTNIANIINGAKRDEIYLSNNEVGHLFQHIKSTLDTSELTDREQQVLPLIMNGFTYHEVASKLDISYETIKSHMKNIYKKLNVKTRGDLLRYAL
ncbi:MAG: LuxR C-terminal-related transcriptional regulator [Ekhidna sp.]